MAIPLTKQTQPRYAFHATNPVQLVEMEEISTIEISVPHAHQGFRTSGLKKLSASLMIKGARMVPSSSPPTSVGAARMDAADALELMSA